MLCKPISPTNLCCTAFSRQSVFN
uniref:Uncharacterized protein n=1 Tax=Rhizophora mucronata TaxID=61149 RepID=A0A2P2QY48_RHIMU